MRKRQNISAQVLMCIFLMVRDGEGLESGDRKTECCWHVVGWKFMCGL